MDISQKRVQVFGKFGHVLVSKSVPGEPETVLSYVSPIPHAAVDVAKVS